MGSKVLSFGIIKRDKDMLKYEFNIQHNRCKLNQESIEIVVATGGEAIFENSIGIL